MRNQYNTFFKGLVGGGGLTGGDLDDLRLPAIAIGERLPLLVDHLEAAGSIIIRITSRLQRKGPVLDPFLSGP